MNFDLWLLYVGTVVLFMSTPGPSHLLMLSTSISNGFPRSIATAAGDLSANVLQIIAAGMGLAAIISSSKYGFSVIKWAGVGYLIWVGARQIWASYTSNGQPREIARTSLGDLWFRGFVTSAANPKAVVFFAALFPQFLSQSQALAPQLLVLGTTYIVVDALFLISYGKTASWLAQRLRGRYRGLVDRIAGASLICAALLLGLRSAERS